MLTRISIVDDDAGIRRNLSKLIDGSGEFRCVSMHASGKEAVKEIPEIRPEVVLMDINLGKMDGIECVARIKSGHPNIQFVILTVYEETEKIFAALEAGATGYLLKRCSTDELFEGIRQVMRGESPMSGPIARKVVQFFQRRQATSKLISQLTPKEYEVLDHMAKGFRYREIADKMGIGPETVRTHIRSIYHKLQVNTKTDAVLALLGKG
jgi:DNA-binding NarL/FixJ family response regulator